MMRGGKHRGQVLSSSIHLKISDFSVCSAQIALRRRSSHSRIAAGAYPLRRGKSSVSETELNGSSSGGALWIYGLVLVSKRPCGLIKQDDAQHVAQDIHPRACSGDDPYHIVMSGMAGTRT
jgi:hypothetical protein